MEILKKSLRRVQTEAIPDHLVNMIDDNKGISHTEEEGRRSTHTRVPERVSFMRGAEEQMNNSKKSTQEIGKIPRQIRKKKTK